MSTDPDAALEGLRRRFLGRAADDLALILEHQARGDLASQELRFIVHRLSGAAGSFGYPAVSLAASRVEAGWTETGEAGAGDLAGLIDELRRLPR